MGKTIAPVIKWTGGKRHMATEIVNYFPKEIPVLWEPFVGGGSIFRRVLDSDIKVGKVICSDINTDLIALWRLIRDNPGDLISGYTELWNQLNSNNDPEAKEDFYYGVRDEFNNAREPIKFFFLTRTSYNGLIRYNGKGQYNSPFHFNRNGMKPSMVQNIVLDWSCKIANVEFVNQIYNNIKPAANDFCFMDPPYFNATGQIYNGKINLKDFLKFLAELPCKWAVTLDGKNEKDDRTVKIPSELFKQHIYISKQNSSFARLLCKPNLIQESLYLNY